MRALSLVLLLLGGTIAAVDDVERHFVAPCDALLADHARILAAWYAQLGQEHLLHLTIPDLVDGSVLHCEIPLHPGLGRLSPGWLEGTEPQVCRVDASALRFGGGRCDGRLRITLPAGVAFDLSRAGAVDLDLEVAGTIAEGILQATLSQADPPLAARGTGRVLDAAAAATRPGARPEYRPTLLPAAACYAIAVALEEDALRRYRTLRALAATSGDLEVLAAQRERDPIPLPLRPPFAAETARDKAVKEERRDRADARIGRLLGKKGPSSDDPLGDDGLLDEVLDAEPVAVSPETLRLRAQMVAGMAAHVAALADALAAGREVPRDAPIARGETVADPLFGPWYGHGSLASDGANHLPEQLDPTAAQDWPFLHAWRFVGPFPGRPAAWDPQGFPDCVPVADTTYAGVGGVAMRWQPAAVRASGCVMVTDLDGLGEEALAERPDQDEEPPARRAVYYAATTLIAPRAMEIWLAAGCAGELCIWHGERLVARGPAVERPQDLDQETLLVRLRLDQGENRLLVRIDADSYGLFTHRRPGTASWFWMRACVAGAPGDPAAGAAWLARVAERKASLPNLPPEVRGYRHDQCGIMPAEDPVRAWDVDDGSNVAWTTPLQRFSKATPLVVGDAVYVCEDPHSLVCCDVATGAVRWRRDANVLEAMDEASFAESQRLHEVWRAALSTPTRSLAQRLCAAAAAGTPLPRAMRELTDQGRAAGSAWKAFMGHLAKHAKLVKPAWDGHYSGPWLGYTFPTPVSDGERIYVKFSTGANAAFTPDGERLWLTHTPYVVGDLGVCASPMLADGKLIIHQVTDPEADQFADLALTITALDAATGTVVWRARADQGSGRPTGGLAVMRLSDGDEDMAVVVSNGGTVLRAADGAVLIPAMRGGTDTATPTPVGDVLYRIGNTHGGAVQLLMRDRDTVARRWLWQRSRMYNAVYAGVAHHEGLLFGICHGGSQSFAGRGLVYIDAATGLPVPRPFNAERDGRGIYAISRFGFIPPIGDGRVVYLAVRGQGHASSLAEELPDRWTPYSAVTVLQHGPLGRILAHNKVVGPLQGHVALAGSRVYLRNDHELMCLDRLGEAGARYEAITVARHLLDDLAVRPEGVDDPTWQAGLALCHEHLQRVVELAPDSAEAGEARRWLRQR